MLLPLIVKLNISILVIFLCLISYIHLFSNLSKCLFWQSFKQLSIIESISVMSGLSNVYSFTRYSSFSFVSQYQIEKKSFQ